MTKHYKDLPDFIITFCCSNNIGLMSKKVLPGFSLLAIQHLLDCIRFAQCAFPSARVFKALIWSEMLPRKRYDNMGGTWEGGLQVTKKVNSVVGWAMGPYTYYVTPRGGRGGLAQVLSMHFSLI